MTHLLLVPGSLRAGSVNAAVLRTIADGPVPTRTFAGLGGLPHFNPDDDVEPLPPSVAALRGAIAAARALLFCTPEYAGALPGALKNLLDWTVGGMETVDKPAGWVNASTAPGGARGAHAELGTVLGYTGALVVDAACADVPVPRGALGPDGRVADPALVIRLRDVAARLAA